MFGALGAIWGRTIGVVDAPDAVTPGLIDKSVPALAEAAGSDTYRVVEAVLSAVTDSATCRRRQDSTLEDIQRLRKRTDNEKSDGYGHTDEHIQ